jgi:hypothetical protein
LTGNKWDISKVEGIVAKSGNGAYINLPKEWLGTPVVVIPKKTWEAMQEEQKQK